MLPFDPFYQRETLFDLLELRRRRFDAFGVAAEKHGEIFQLRLDAVARVDIRLELRIEGRELRNPPPHIPKLRENRIVALVQRGVALGAQALDPVSARENLTDRGQLGVLGGIFQHGAIQLGQLKRQQVHTSVAIPCGGAHPITLRLARAHRLERGSRWRKQCVKTTEGVQHSEMRRRIEQRLMLVLPVQLYQPRRQILQRTGCGERAVDERAAAPLSGDFPTDEQLFSAIFENRFNRGRVLAGADEVARGSTAEQQPDGFDKDRLSRPGFAREDVEPGIEFDLDRVDDREVPYAQETKHVEKRENSNRSIGLTAVLHHDTVLHSRCPSGALQCPGGPFAHAWKPDIRPAHAGARRGCTRCHRCRSAEHIDCPPSRRVQSSVEGGACHPRDFLDCVVGNHPLQAVDISRRAKTNRAVPRCIPSQQ